MEQNEADWNTTIIFMEWNAHAYCKQSDTVKG